MKKIIASIAAAGVLVAGAFIASTVTGSEASAQTDEAPVVRDEARRPPRGAILNQVLDDLVENKTLTEDQAEAVKKAIVAKRDELKDKFGDRAERRVRRRRIRAQIQEWLLDGAITEAELSELDIDLPIFEEGPLADALKDGKITQAEWDAFVDKRRADRRARKDANS